MKHYIITWLYDKKIIWYKNNIIKRLYGEMIIE